MNLDENKTIGLVIRALDQSCKQMAHDEVEQLRFRREAILKQLELSSVHDSPLHQHVGVLSAAGVRGMITRHQTVRWVMVTFVMMAMLVLAYSLGRKQSMSPKHRLVQAPATSQQQLVFYEEDEELLQSQLPPQAYSDKGFTRYVTLIEE